MATPNYAITTQEAQSFWASRHKLNRAKAIIAFSKSKANANDNFRRMGYGYFWRKRLINAFAEYVNQPEMKNIPYSPDKDSPEWWIELAEVEKNNG